VSGSGAARGARLNAAAHKWPHAPDCRAGSVAGDDARSGPPRRRWRRCRKRRATWQMTAQGHGYGGCEIVPRVNPGCASPAFGGNGFRLDLVHLPRVLLYICPETLTHHLDISHLET
jgi:hypothetical protein